MKNFGDYLTPKNQTGSRLMGSLESSRLLNPLLDKELFPLSDSLEKHVNFDSYPYVFENK